MSEISDLVELLQSTPADEERYRVVRWAGCTYRVRVHYEPPWRRWHYATIDEQLDGQWVRVAKTARCLRPYHPSVIGAAAKQIIFHAEASR